MLQKFLKRKTMKRKNLHRQKQKFSKDLPTSKSHTLQNAIMFTNGKKIANTQ